MRIDKLSHRTDGEARGWAIHTSPECKAWYLFEGGFERLASPRSMSLAS